MENCVRGRVIRYFPPDPQVVGCGAFCETGGPFRSHCALHPDPSYGCDDCLCP